MNGRFGPVWQCSRVPANIMRGVCSFVLLPVVLVAACQTASRAKEEEAVQVEVRAVSFDQLSNSPVVILQDKGGKKAIPIWVGTFEAQAIYLELQGKPTPRPLTHDLMKNILEQVGVEFEKIVVSELKGSTYYARIHLVNAGKPLEIDSRPSDAIALALRFHRPIFVAKALFEAAIPSQAQEARTEPTSEKVAGVTVQDLTTELAAYFQLPERSGVLVADAAAGSGDDYLQRGDIILAVDGEAVHDVAEFRAKIDKDKRSAVTLRVKRDGQERGVRLLSTEE